MIIERAYQIDKSGNGNLIKIIVKKTILNFSSLERFLFAQEFSVFVQDLRREHSLTDIA